MKGGINISIFRNGLTVYKNEYGVEGRKTSSGRFVDKDGKHTWIFIPECCFNCYELDVETGDYGEQITPYYCKRNIRFPTRKGTCKRQRI